MGLWSTNSSVDLPGARGCLYTWGLLRTGVLTKRELSSLLPRFLQQVPRGMTPNDLCQTKKSFLKCCITFIHASVVSRLMKGDQRLGLQREKLITSYPYPKPSHPPESVVGCFVNLRRCCQAQEELERVCFANE